MKGKILYSGQWVKVRNMMNKRFKADGPCSICRRLSCATVWYSIRTHEVRCLKCFDAEKEHFDEMREMSRKRHSDEGENRDGPTQR